MAAQSSMSIVRLSLLLTALPYASTESYVVYNPVTHTSAPPPRALGSAVLQHTVSNTVARSAATSGTLAASRGAQPAQRPVAARHADKRVGLAVARRP